MPTDTNELTTLRASIDELDRNLIHLLAKRQKLARSVATLKIQDNMALWAEKRVDSILKTRAQWAKEYEMNPRLIEDLFRRIIEHNTLFSIQMLQESPLKK